MTDDHQPEPELTPRQWSQWDAIIWRCTGRVRGGIDLGNAINSDVLRSVDARLRWLEAQAKERTL